MSNKVSRGVSHCFSYVHQVIILSIAGVVDLQVIQNVMKY